jgi:acyl-CoA reductase-like NAD-dependent aldehyde dehydrogenase
MSDKKPRYETIKVDGVYIGVPKGQSPEEREKAIAHARDHMANDPEYLAAKARHDQAAERFKAKREQNQRAADLERYKALYAQFEGADPTNWELMK